jgi:hypothetical protein
MNRRSFAVGAALAALAVLAPSGSARARPRDTYVFLISRVDLGKGIPAEVKGQTSARVDAAILAHEELAPALGQDAPDPEAEPQKFKKYLKARRQRAFKVNVEVTQYSIELEPVPGARSTSSQYLTVRAAVRLFGETVPDRVMAFTGDGSATVKLEVGKTVRPRDRDEATSSALDQAVAGAIAQALRKLDEVPPSEKKKKPGKR